MSLTKEEVLYFARLARLALTDEEVEKFQRQLSQVLEYVAQLQKVKTEGIEPIKQIAGLYNVMREDKVEPIDKEMREALLEQAPQRKDDLIETLNVFE
jgi:aspartyl-tRNA(Asn)/glutamyl-tRNA(Gln) amidotransferase subunit C